MSDTSKPAVNGDVTKSGAPEDFDPAKATAEELSSRGMDAMFDLAVRQRVQNASTSLGPTDVEQTDEVETLSSPPLATDDFDPSAAPVEELRRRGLNEMFDLAKTHRQEAAKAEEQFREALAIELTKKDKLKVTTILQSRVPVIIYARYSDDAQNPKSIDDQIAECQHYCAVMGYEPVLICSDAAQSGMSKVDRAGWLKVERAVAAGLAKVVVSKSLDRVARAPIDLLVAMESFRLCGAVIDTPSTGAATELHGLIHGIYVSLFHKMLVDKVMRGMAGAVRRGKHPGGTSYGLRKARHETDEDLDEWLPYEDEVRIYFRIMWEIGVLKRSYSEIAIDLNREGIPAPKGGLWAPQNFVHPNGLAGLTLSKRCVGIIVWNKAKYTTNRSTKEVTVTKNNSSQYVIGFNAKQAFIPRWLWNLVQEEVAARRLGPNGRTGAVPRRLLTNRLVCGTCGRGMHVIAADSKGRPRVGCSTVKARAPCAMRRTFYLDTIEKMFAHAMGGFVSSPELVRSSFEGKVAEIEQKKQELMRERDDKTAERDGLAPMTAELVRKMAAAGVEGDDLLKIINQELKPLYHKQQEYNQRIQEIDLMLASDELNPEKMKEIENVFADLELLLEETGGKNLPRTLIKQAQELFAKVSIHPEADSRHFELRINGRFDAMLKEDLLSSAAIIGSEEYKNAKTAGSSHPDKLTIGKAFHIAVHSMEAGIPVESEVRERSLGRLGPVLARRKRREEAVAA